jgi:hypothetical protein
MAENTPNATPRRICPLLTAGTVKTATVVAPGEADPHTTLTPIQCIGPACQLWVHEANPEIGECGIGLTAVFTSTTAGQLVEVNNSLVALGSLVAAIAAAAKLDVKPPSTATA